MLWRCLFSLIGSILQLLFRPVMRTCSNNCYSSSIRVDFVVVPFCSPSKSISWIISIVIVPKLECCLTYFSNRFSLYGRMYKSVGVCIDSRHTRKTILDAECSRHSARTLIPWIARSFTTDASWSCRLVERVVFKTIRSTFDKGLFVPRTIKTVKYWHRKFKRWRYFLLFR